MTGDRCARCGRVRAARGGSREDVVTDALLPLQGAAEEPWASIEGQDVCPRCQTPEERDDAARRVVAAIEREVERRRGEGIPPDPHELALIGYAMGARDAVEGSADDDLQTDPRAQPGSADRPDSTRLRVAVTGAFLTGRPLAVRIDGYAELQSALGRALKGPQWRLNSLGAQGGTYESGGGFSEAVPLIIARREGADLLPWLAAALDDSSHAEASWLGTGVAAFNMTPISFAIDVYDLGVAVMIAWFDVVGAAGTDLAATARAIKRLVRLRADDHGVSPLAARLQGIANDAAGQYGDAVIASAPQELQAAWLSRATPHPSARSQERLADERGRLLWLHPIHVLHTSEQRERALQDLVPVFHERIALDGGVFAAGIGSSAVVASPGSRAPATPVRLTKLHWAYYALYMEIDRGLLGVLNQQRWSKQAPLKELEADADAVFADYLRVTNARARLDSHLSALGGDEFAIWEAVAKVQRFDAVAEAVECKLDVLEKVAKRRVEQASAYRARRLGEILGGLTVLTVVTVAVALITTFLGSRSHGISSLWVRAAIVVIAAAVSIVLYWAAFIRTTRARPEATGRQTS
jgi:hypothetical protein